MRSLLALCLIHLTPTVALCQSNAPANAETSPDKETATVAGQVLRLDTGEPLMKAQVSLLMRGRDAFSSFRLTDEQGRFSIVSIPSGPLRRIRQQIPEHYTNRV